MSKLVEFVTECFTILKNLITYLLFFLLAELQ